MGTSVIRSGPCLLAVPSRFCSSQAALRNSLTVSTAFLRRCPVSMWSFDDRPAESNAKTRSGSITPFWSTLSTNARNVGFRS